MSKFELKGYKEKFNKMKSDKNRDFKKIQEEESVSRFNELLSAYTDVVDEEKDKEYNLFHYGVIRNPETEKTIIGVKEDEVGNYTEFVIDFIDVNDVIGMVQVANEKFEELFDGISKDDIIQRIYNNEGFVAPIINALFFTDNGGEEYNYENEITMDKETLKEYLENDSYESSEIDDYEFSYDENGEIEDMEEKKKYTDVMPESKDYSNIEDEFYFMNGYKVVFKDDKGNCRLFESKSNERLAKIYAENLVKDLKERNFKKDGSRVSIIAPFSINEKNVIRLDESVISLKEELDKRKEDGTGPHGKRNRRANEKCLMNEENDEKPLFTMYGNDDDDDDDELNMHWENYQYDIDYMLDKIGGLYNIKCTNVGWQNKSGELDLEELYDFEDFVDIFSVNGDYSIRVYWDEKSPEFDIRMSHHDSPTGEFYSAVKVDESEEEDE